MTLDWSKAPARAACYDVLDAATGANLNELAIVCRELNVDLWDAIACAATKPFGFQAFYPGPGVGGHCIPVDPNYLTYKVRTLGQSARLHVARFVVCVES